MECSQPAGNQIISHRFNPPFMAFSYIVSLIGAWTTLEVLERQTATRGGYNWFIIVLASVIMTAVGIWGMHFVGNSALIIGDDSSQDGICYDVTWTIGSLVLPVIVMGVAFLTFAKVERTNWFTAIFGALASGAAICGMHFSGQIGMSNYENVFDWRYVLGSAVLSCVAAGASLGVFFWLKGSWKNNWWKRGITAAFLAASVSSMHWIAMAGTSYRPKPLSNIAKIPSQYAGILCGILAAVCSAVLLSIVVTWHRIRRQSLQKTEQITLSMVCFNGFGHILVTNTGYLPCKKVDNHYIEQDSNDTFEVGHEVFIWLFRASRNWPSIEPLVPQMRRHLREDDLLRRLGKSRRLSWNDDPEYLKKLKERLAVAATELRLSMHGHLPDIGVLYDKMIYTGTVDVPKKRSFFKTLPRAFTNSHPRASQSEDSEAGGKPIIGRGQMLFLVRHVNSSEQSSLESAGFTFRPPHICIDSLTKSLRVTQREFLPLFNDLQRYDVVPAMLRPGVYLAALAVRPQFSGSKWTILAQKRARNLLPLVKVDLPKLEKWQADLIIALRGTNSDVLFQTLRHGRQRLNAPPGPEERFKGKLFDAMITLRARIGIDTFSKLRLAEKILPGPVSVSLEGRDQTTAALVICLYGIVDLHHVHPSDAADEFTPARMVLAHQRVYPTSMDHVDFLNSVRDEFERYQDHEPSQDVSWLRDLVNPRLLQIARAVQRSVRPSQFSPRTHALASLTPSPGPPATDESDLAFDNMPVHRLTHRTQRLDIHVSNQINVDIESLDSSQSAGMEETEWTAGDYGVSSHIEANSESPSMIENFLGLLEQKHTSVEATNLKRIFT